MRKTKIMFVMLQLDAGGSERVVLDLARNLNLDQFEIYITAFSGGALEVSFREACKEIFFIKKAKAFDFSAMRRLARIVREQGIDVINAHHYMPCFYSFLGTRVMGRKKLIYTEHSVPEVEEVASSIHGKIFFWMLFRLNAVVGVSEQITEKFKQKYPVHADKFLSILNGVDVKALRKREKREEIRANFGFLQDHFVIGTVANFKTVKNHACLVRAAARVKEYNPKLRLFFVGTGFPGDPDNSEDVVRELIHELGLQNEVVMAGYQENIAGMLSALDAFCLPSFSEGLPVSLLEAMAAGLPVIGSNVRGVIEVIKDRQTGLLFNSDDDIDLCEKIKEIMGNSSFVESLTAEAYDFVKSNHDIGAWVGNYADVFRN